MSRRKRKGELVGLGVDTAGRPIKPGTLPALLDQAQREGKAQLPTLADLGVINGLRRWTVQTTDAGFQVVQHPLGPYVLYADVQPDAIAEHDKTDTLQTLDACINTLTATRRRIQEYKP